MGSVLHPVGSQPVAVYWRRRAVLLVALVLVVGLVVAWLARPAEPAPAAVAASSVSPGSGTPAASEPVASTPAPSPTPTGPPACAADNTALDVAGYRKVKTGGQQVFKVALTNTGAVSCDLNLSAANFALTVSSGKDRIFSTADCPKLVPAKKGSLAPGKAHEFSINWSLVRSAAGCKTSKTTARPGTYVGAGAFAATVTGRQVFTIEKK